MTVENRTNLLQLSNQPPNPFIGKIAASMGGLHTCNMQYRGIRENAGKPYEVFVCSDPECQREEWRPYSGCYDTIEGRM